jgi:hypothetical protein
VLADARGGREAALAFAVNAKGERVVRTACPSTPTTVCSMSIRRKASLAIRAAQSRTSGRQISAGCMRASQYAVV